VRCKSGALMGVATAAYALISAPDNAPAAQTAGVQLGRLYQMLDDLLDYTPAMDTGKPSLQDWSTRRWTWPLFFVADPKFDRTANNILQQLRRGGERAPLQQALAHFGTEVYDVVRAFAEIPGRSGQIAVLIDHWLQTATEAVCLELATDALRPSAPTTLAKRSRSFRFAACWLPPRDRARIERVYQFCRVLDDLADRPGAPPDTRRAAINDFLANARRSYDGARCGDPIIDGAMRDAAAAAVPFDLVTALGDGMRMDLAGTIYRTRVQLGHYAYCVAGTVGQWLTILFGRREAWVLEAAAELGHAMQLTNIVRDVGEDLAADRIYLPEDLLRQHGLSRRALLQHPERLPDDPDYHACLEVLAQEAEHAYARAYTAMHALPRGFRRPVAVAAAIYEGILIELRANHYDNIYRRAQTGPWTKCRLAYRGLRRLRAANQLEPAQADINPTPNGQAAA